MKQQLAIVLSVRSLLALVGALLFAIGVLTGQQHQRSKFEKYYRLGTATFMDIALLNANLEIVREAMPNPTTSITYDFSCGCFSGLIEVTGDTIHAPLSKARTMLEIKAFAARSAIQRQFTEIPTLPLDSPDPYFRMLYREYNWDDGTIRDFAEYANGKLVFK